MRIHTKAISYRQNGCNRGGTDHISQLVEKLPELSDVAPTFELVDAQPGRAAGLAPILASRGVAVRVSGDTAPLPPTATADVYAVDDVGAPARALEHGAMSSLVEVGLLVSAPTIESVGGVVTAVAGAATPDATTVRKGLHELLHQLEGLVPRRQSSARMAARGVHAEQMPRARYAAHDWLTTRSASFLKEGEVEAGIAMIDGFTGAAYQVEVAEARRDDRRRDLRNAVLNDILPEITERGNHRGVVFHERQDPWLYVVFAHRGPIRWQLARAFELPVLRLQLHEEPVEAPTFVTD